MANHAAFKRYGLLALKIIGWIVGVLLLLFFVLIFTIRSPWGQNLIVQKASNFLSTKIDTKFSIGRLFITFDGNAYLEDVYLEDQAGDTLIYSKNLEASVALIPIISNNEINIDYVEWEKLVARVKRDSSTGEFNFQYIIDAFASDSTTQQVDTTTSSSPTIDVGDIHFADFDLLYQDQTLGIDSRLLLGSLDLSMDELDLDKMLFHIDELTLKDIDGHYTQTLLTTSDTSTEEDSTESILPTIIVDELNVYNLKGSYHSPPTLTFFDGQVDKFETEIPLIDLTNQKIQLDKLVLHQSEIAFSSYPRATSSPDSASTSTGFSWPEWDVVASNIDLSNNDVLLITDSTTLEERVFNPAHIDIKDFNLSIDQALLKKEQATLVLDALNFKERSGVSVDELNFEINISNQEINIQNLNFLSEENQLSGLINVKFNSLNEFINNPTLAELKSDLSIELHSLDASYAFQPSLDTISYLHLVDQKVLAASLDIEGSMSKLDLNKAVLNWGKSTSFKADGIIYSINNPDSIHFEDLNYLFKSTKTDLSTFLNLDITGIDLPQSFQFKGNTTGSLSEIASKNSINTSDGNILINGNLKRSSNQIAFETSIKTDSLRIGKILQNTELGPLTVDLEASGNGSSLNDLDAQLVTTIKSLQYGDYTFEELLLSGNLKNGTGTLNLDYNDYNLELGLSATAKLDSLTQKADLQINLKGADLLALGITKEDIRTKLTLDAQLINTERATQVTFEINDAVVVKELENYTINKISGDYYSTSDSTSAHITSDVINARLESNTSPGSFTTALRDQLAEYLRSDSLTNSIIPADSGIVVRAHLSVKQDLLVSDILLPGLQQYDSITLTMDYLEAKDSLSILLNAPYINYADQILDSLRVKAIGAKQKLNFSAGWSSIEAGPISMKQFDFSGFAQDNKLVMRLDAPEDKGSIIDIRAEMKIAGDTLDFYIEPDTFIMHRKMWIVPEQNNILIAPNYLHFENFSLTHKNQKITLSNFGEENPYQNLKVQVDQFNLMTLSSFLNPTDTLVSGVMNGEISVSNLFSNSALLADLSINRLASQGINFGNLNLKAEKGSDSDYKFNMTLQGGQADLALKGSFIPSETGANLDLGLEMNRINAEIMEAFLSEEISNPEGYFTGTVSIKGNTAEPKYNGELQFHDFGLKVNSLNTRFAINNESLKVDNKGIYLNSFKIQDQDQNAFTIKGNILTESLTNPTFDLSLTARNFTALNSDKDDNELFYGKVGLDADLTVKGNLAIPKIRGSIGILKNSDFTMIVPESQADLVEREGVVVFVNKQNPDDILTRKDEDANNTVSALTGLDLNTNLNIGTGATFKIVINERTGDNFQISGKGEFNFGMEPNGRTTLAGIYTVSDGHFEASLYNLVKRRFDLAPGGTINWSGDPLSAELDIQAIYNVKASPAPLLLDDNNANQQQLPFEVYLNLDGTILQPELSFGLDLPENSRGANGGQVYRAVQALNNSEEQLNKQVFSLLVLNRFFPTAGSDGSSGGTASIARNNVNNVLSSQLNSLSNKVTGNSGFQVDFGINSYTDYQGETSQERTDVNINASQRLFDDRVIVQVGSEVNVEGSTMQESDVTTPLIGNVSIEYLVTKNGRYRFKGFRKNEYQNIIDGQLIVTGFAFIFSREFNRFQEIWRKEVEETQSESND
ncbi:translocation/assembly module TamB domain-containing protein [Marinoscillum pacificum]|uniref:translocation/assembly module TamB domain-containing protein n=1 Tax=Marinoscillum pacificum TaxID=392723 RepID=UPI002157EC4D|nr:translocation/assembly module TamB [Marinoscillum pacificum]